MVDKNKLIKNLSLQQGAIKILINSIYGASGNKWFYFYNLDIAQSITLQGQDMIKFANRAIDYYFKEKWHLDTELHEKLGISQYEIEPISKDIIIAIYTDTDSTYVNYGPAIDSIKGLDLSIEEGIKLCIKIIVLRVGGSKLTASLFGVKLLDIGFLIYLPLLLTFPFHIFYSY